MTAVRNDLPPLRRDGMGNIYGFWMDARYGLARRIDCVEERDGEWAAFADGTPLEATYDSPEAAASAAIGYLRDC